MLSTLQQDRIAWEFMIAEQNRAYQESLDADREKVVKYYYIVACRCVTTFTEYFVHCRISASGEAEIREGES